MPPMAGALDFLSGFFEERGGAVSFEDFMAAALYHPEYGYYTTGISDVGGRSADFATAATLSNALGSAVAGWIEEKVRANKGTDDVALIEVGAGGGALAEAVLDALDARDRTLRRRVRYAIVEKSPVLAGLQRERLAGKGVIWHDAVASCLREFDGRALIFSNELVDAFPVQWLRHAQGQWFEVWVRFRPDTGLREEFRPVALDESTQRSLADWSVPDGQRIELRPSYRSWLGEWVKHWHAGAMLTIDYGAPTRREVYAGRPDGSLRGYWHHQRIERGGVYARFGKQDLTADVVFSDLVEWGEALGLVTERLETQRDFLTRWGAGEDIMAAGEVGEAFWVLEQNRG